MALNTAEIPLIDIAAWLSPDSTSIQRDDVIDQVRQACIEYGFFQVVGHGVPLELQYQVLQCSRDFFSLPLSEKMEVAQARAMGMSARGYEILGGQTLQSNALPDMKEGYFIGPEIPAEHPRAGKFLEGPNLWPKSLGTEAFEQPLQEYRTRMVKLSEAVLHILALGLPGAMNPTFFKEFCTNASANLRLLHYPPQSTTDERQLGAGAHTDFGGLTFVLQQPDTSGLQVFYPPTQMWIPVPAREDTFVANIGDLLARWTCGYYRSALHRVLNIGTEHRYSAPFFYNGNVDYTFHKLGGDGDKTRVTVRDHILGRLRASLGQKVDGDGLAPQPREKECAKAVVLPIADSPDVSVVPLATQLC